MAINAKVIGVHPVKTDEPVHLIELLIEFDIGELTQEVAGQPKSNWQAPYDDRSLEESDGKARYAFFFHYLNLNLPLIGPTGDLNLPKPTKVPPHLRDIEYEEP